MLNKLERETILLFNEEEKLATVYTHNKRLINQLNKLAQNSQAITIEKQTEESCEYTLPKSWIKIKSPRQLSAETRAKLSEQAKRNLHSKSGDEK